MAQILVARQALEPSFYDDVFYWAAGPGSIEVDFLLRRGDEYVAIEVQARVRLAGDSFAGLLAIDALPGVTRRILVYLGDRPFRHEAGIDVMPFPDFLREFVGVPGA